MKKRILCLAAGALLYLFARGVPAKTDSLAIPPAVQRVFPFQVGQQYEFKSSGWFFRPNGDSLPPNTVATITVSDTVVNGKTYLRIPYWSPFGTEYYRMDDSLRLWELIFGQVPAEFSFGRCGSVPNYAWHARFWSYQSAYSPHLITDAGPRSHVGFGQGWVVAGEDSCFAFWVNVVSGNRQVSAQCGGSAAGLAKHCASDSAGNRYLWGVFRPVSSDPWPFLDDVVSVQAGKPEPVSLDMILRPNPFNPSTTVTYSIASGGNVRVEVFDLAGQRVREIENRYRTPGRHVVMWDGRDDRGRQVASGVYLVRLMSSQGMIVRKAALIR